MSSQLYNKSAFGRMRQTVEGSSMPQHIVKKILTGIVFKFGSASTAARVLVTAYASRASSGDIVGSHIACRAFEKRAAAFLSPAIRHQVLRYPAATCTESTRKGAKELFPTNQSAARTVSRFWESSPQLLLVRQGPWNWLLVAAACR